MSSIRSQNKNNGNNGNNNNSNNNNNSKGKNQRTWALCSTMSDANGRPIMTSMPGDAVPFRLNGAPVIIASLMPDVAPVSTSVAFGNWKQAYIVVTRKGVTLQQDPYFAGFCLLFKLEARVGGTVVYPNAARLLRIR